MKKIIHFLALSYTISTFAGCAGMNEVERWNTLGVKHYHKGNYYLAIQHHKKALNLEFTKYSSQGKPVIKTLGLLGSTWSAKGKYDKAIAYYQNALNLKLNSMGPHNPELATSWNNIVEK